MTWQDRKCVSMQQYSFLQLVRRCNCYTIFLIHFPFHRLPPFRQPFDWWGYLLRSGPNLYPERAGASMILSLGFLLLDTVEFQGTLWFPWLSCQSLFSLVKSLSDTRMFFLVFHRVWGTHTNQVVTIAAKSMEILLFTDGGWLFSSFYIHSSVLGPRNNCPSGH